MATSFNGLFAAIFENSLIGMSILRILSFEGLTVTLRIHTNFRLRLDFAHRWEGSAITEAYRAEDPTLQDGMSVHFTIAGCSMYLIHDRIVSSDLVNSSICRY